MYYFYKIGQFIALSLPLRAGYAIASFLAVTYYYFALRDRRILAENLKIVLKKRATPVALRVYTRRAFINFAKYLVDFFRFTAINKEFIDRHVKVEGAEHCDSVMKYGKGMIVLSSHIGNWELGAAVISSLGHHIYALALNHEDKKATKFFIEQRNACGVDVIALKFVLKKCIKVLRDNKVLAILGDRDFTNNGERIKFFGKDAYLPKGPAFFSLRTGAPIVPAFLIRMKKDQFKFFIEKPIYPKSTGNPKNDIKNLMNDYIKVSERFIKRYPDQWYVFTNIWS